MSQGMNSYILSMDEMSRKVGRMSRRFEFAEGWRRHLHLGFASEEFNPLMAALGADYKNNEKRSVKRGTAEVK